MHIGPAPTIFNTLALNGSEHFYHSSALYSLVRPKEIEWEGPVFRLIGETKSEDIFSNYIA